MAEAVCVLASSVGKIAYSSKLERCPNLLYTLLAAVNLYQMETSKKREMALLETVNHNQDYWDAELRIGINGQTGLQVKQCMLRLTQCHIQVKN